MDKKLMYKTPRASVRGVYLCDSVADTVCSPVRGADVTPWIEAGETDPEVDGGYVFLTL
jgi:hypothetical protein